jgi:N6-adenosine-specific RNA methylase IME4
MIDFPDKKYEVIYSDPPWSYRQQGKTARGIAANHYDTMTVEDICNLPVREIATDNAICFMWATFPNISEALRVMDAWGFEYKTAAFVWVKKNTKTPSNFWGMGAYTRANAEVCLLGVSKGTKAKQQVINNGVHQIIEAPIARHSKKPDIVRDKIVQLLGDRPRIELFARQITPGWDVWGNEV